MRRIFRLLKQNCLAAKYKCESGNVFFFHLNKTCFSFPSSLHLYLPAASKKQRVRFSNIMEVRQLPSTQALEAKLSRMSYPAAKDHEAMLRTVGKLTITDVAKISFFFCFVVSKSQQEFQLFIRTSASNYRHDVDV